MVSVDRKLSMIEKRIELRKEKEYGWKRKEVERSNLNCVKKTKFM
jgi:hypothetical protein